MKNKFIIFKNFFAILIFYLFSMNYSLSEVIKNFNIVGNDRVSSETVIMFSKLDVGDKVNNDILNKALKELYYTNYFKDVKISFDGSTINIILNENPIIQSVIVKGIDENDIKKNPRANIKN